MHLFGIVAVIIAWGVGMIVRPAATLFLTILVVGFFYMVVHNLSRPPDVGSHNYVHWDDRTETYVLDTKE